MKECLGAKWLTDKTWYPPVKSAEGPTCYIVTEAIEEDFKEFLAGSGATVVEEADADGYKIYVLDHDYTVWVDD